MKKAAVLMASLWLFAITPAIAAGRTTGLQATVIGVADFQKSMDFYGALGMVLSEGCGKVDGPGDSGAG